MSETLNLTKGETVNLEKQAGKPLTKIILGLGWDAASEGANIDLDASAVLYNGGNTKVGHVFFNEKTAPGITHSGDNLTGEGEGDDEQIVVELNALGADVEKILLTITSYQGQTLDAIKNAFARVVNADDNTELAKYDMSGMGAKKGLYVGLLTKAADGWSFKAIGEVAEGEGKTFNDLVPNATPYLS